MSETYRVPEAAFEGRVWPPVCPATGRPTADTRRGHLGWMSRFHLIAVGVGAGLVLGLVAALLISSRWPTTTMPIASTRRRLLGAISVLSTAAIVVGFLALGVVWLNTVGGPPIDEPQGMEGTFFTALAAIAGGLVADVAARQLLWIGGSRKRSYVVLRRLHPEFVAAVGVRPAPSPAAEERGG